jgi:hypothetical protein
MPRTLLYYPTITIKSPSWIKQAILYWDDIGSIVPREVAETPHQLLDLTILAQYGLYRIFDPGEYVNQDTELADEFIAFLKSRKERGAIEDTSQVDRFEIYSGKMHRMLREYLVENDYAVDIGYDKLSVTKVEGLCYMAFLAKYLADEAYRSATTPSTDYGLYRDLVFSPNSPQRGFPGLNFALHNVLPIPLDDVPIEEILEFKRRRELELFQFREVIDQFEVALKQVQEKGEIQHVLQVFSERIKMNVEVLDRLANDERISTRLGTLENILKIENLETVLDLAEIVTNPISISTARKVFSGSLSAGKYMLDKSNEQRRNLSLGSYSLLYYAKEEGIIERP